MKHVEFIHFIKECIQFLQENYTAGNFHFSYIQVSKAHRGHRKR